MATERTVRLIAKLKDDISPGMRLLRQGAAAVATALVGVATAAFAATKQLAGYGAAVYDTHTRTGVSIQSAQALAYAFEQTGGSAQNLEGTIRGLTSFMRTASQGGTEQIETLTRLGLSYDDLAAMSPEDQFLTITDRLGSMTDETQRAIDAQSVFGARMSQNVISALEQADGSLRNLVDQFGELGAALSDEQITALKRFDDAMTDLDYRMRGLQADVLTPLIPAFKELVDAFADAAEGAGPELVVAIGQIVTALTTLLNVGKDVDDWLKDIGIEFGKMPRIVQGAINPFFALSVELEKYGLISRDTEINVISLNEVMEGHADVLRDLNLEQVSAALSAYRFAEAQMLMLDAMSGGTGVFDAQIERVRSMITEMEAAAVSLTTTTIDVTGRRGSGSGGDDATKNAEDLKAALGGAKERIDGIEKTALSLKDALANVKDHTIVYKEDLKLIYEQEQAAYALEQERVQAIAAGFAGLFSGLTLAAMEGQDALDAWFDRFKQRLLELVVSSAFNTLLGVLTPGGFLSGIFGGLFAGGGGIPRAAGGLVVPGSMSVQGDRVPILAQPGEVVLSRQNLRDLKDGMGRGGMTIQVDYRPILSTASSAEIGRLGVEVRKALRKVGVAI